MITLYYYEELTLREIGEVLGVTESRVSQLHTKAILRLKARLGRHRRGARRRRARDPRRGDTIGLTSDRGGLARMPAQEPGKIRNVAVVGHRGTGKTSLVEALLFQSGAVNRLGTVEAGHDRLRLGRGRAAAADVALGLARARRVAGAGRST